MANNICKNNKMLLTIAVITMSCSSFYFYFTFYTNYKKKHAGVFIVNRSLFFSMHLFFWVILYTFTFCSVDYLRKSK
jgi:hypothetical protein